MFCGLMLYGTSRVGLEIIRSEHPLGEFSGRVADMYRDPLRVAWPSAAW